MPSLHSSSTMSSNNDNQQPQQGSQPWAIAIIVLLMRLVVGGIFVFSGFVKAIDPWGTMYKVNEYLMTLGWDRLADMSLFFAFALPVIELLLGVAIVVGAYRRSAPIGVLVMMAFMLPLTLWLATTNAVPDCGCFGDALVLTNWATFGKNLLLTMGAVFLLIFGRKVAGVFGPAVQWMVMAATFVATMAIALPGYFTQPLMDFRPFQLGTRLVSSQPSTSAQDYLFIYEKDGQQHEFTIDSVPNEEDGWTFVDRREAPTAQQPASQEGSRAIAVTDHGTDAADELLEADSLLLLLFPDLPQVSIATTFVINELTDKAREQGVSVYGITSASDGQIAEWTDISMASYPMLVADDSDIKMMARGNPAVVYLDNDTIKWKRTLGSISADVIHDRQLTLDRLGEDIQPASLLRKIAIFYAMALVVILVLNRTHLLVRPLFTRKNKKVTEATETSKNNNTNLSNEQEK